MNVAYHLAHSISSGQQNKGQTTDYSGPHIRQSIENPPRDADGKIPAENLSDLLGRVSESSMAEIDNLVGEFQRLREKLRTDGERIQREIEEYSETEPNGDAIRKPSPKASRKFKHSLD